MTEFYRQPAIQSGSVRAVLFFVVWVILIAIIEMFGLNWVQDVFPEIDERSIPFRSASRGFSLGVSFLIVFVFRTWIDRRPFFHDWFTFTNRQIDLIYGFLTGVVILGLGSFILAQFNVLRFTAGSMNEIEFWQYILFFFIVSLLEELVFRGYILTNLLDDMHPLLALVLSSGFFILIHLFNPNIQMIPLLNLFLAGLLLGASFLYTRNLWFPIGLHWSWNLFQGPVFGFEVSGFPTKSLFNQTILRDNIWSGGLFGFEGSLLATILIITFTVIIYFTFKRLTSHENS